MIAQIRGTVVFKDIDHAIVDVGGVGYHVNLSVFDLAELAMSKDEVLLHTYTYIREGVSDLYGFLHREAKSIFKLLIGISGIGPKLGMSILSGMAIDEFREAVVGGNFRRIKMIPGVGQKTAERIILELKDKKLEQVGRKMPQKRVASDLYDDLFSALKNLGYKEKKIQKVLEKLRRDHPQGDFHILLRQSLNLI